MVRDFLKSFDVLVLGSGLAGQAVALRLAENRRVALVTKRAIEDSATARAQGGIAAAPAPLGIGVPALWECKTMNAKNWRACVKDGVAVAKPVYAAQIALYQAYMEGTIPGISAHPALFTAINKDTAELHHELVPFDAGLAQRMSDRGVRILQATDAGELLPRIATNRDFFECRFCPWAARCWGLPE